MDKFKSMTPLNATIVGLVLTLLFYLTIFDNSGSQKKGIVRADQALVGLKKDLSELEKALVNARKLEKLAQELGESLGKVMKYIPEDLKDSEIVKSLSVSARSVGAKIVGVRSQSKGGSSNRSSKDGADFYSKIPVSVDLMGTFGQTMAFLSQLTKVERIYTIEDMIFIVQKGKKREPTKVKFSTTVVGYKYQPPKEDSDALKGGAK